MTRSSPISLRWQVWFTRPARRGIPNGVRVRPCYLGLYRYSLHNLCCHDESVNGIGDDTIDPHDRIVRLLPRRPWGADSQVMQVITWQGPLLP